MCLFSILFKEEGFPVEKTFRLRFRLCSIPLKGSFLIKRKDLGFRVSSCKLASNLFK